MRVLAPFSVILGLAALVLVWLHTSNQSVHVPGDGEPGGRRFDYFSFANESGGDATNVRIWLYKTGGGMWSTCPSTGWNLGTVPTGDVVTWVLHREESEGVEKVVCAVTHQKPGTEDMWTQQCEIDVGDNWYANSATFYLGNPQAAATGPDPDHELVGEAITTGSVSGRQVRPHTNQVKTPGP